MEDIEQAIQRKKQPAQGFGSNTEMLHASAGPLEEQLSVQIDVGEKERSAISEEPCQDEGNRRDTRDLSELVEQDPRLEEEWDVIEDFLSDQSCSSDVNFESIFREAENVFKTFCEAGDVQKTQTMKSRVVTFVFRQLSSLLCLSKKQNYKIVDFLKRAMVFITPECENVAKRIFASYDSCRRQSLKEAGKGHLLCKQYMEQCLFFSISADTALFQNAHFISCITRFTFDTVIYELPLFITKCDHSSGEDLALFIFNNLKDKKAQFEKLTSISTDGASNMVGRYHGMTTNFKRLVGQYCRANLLRSPITHSVWCFAHRLNLVTRSFLTMRPVNFVLSFADWFSNKRRQVSYKRFLVDKQGNENSKSSHSHQRRDGFFYMDVVQAILSQTRFVERFVLEEPDFHHFWRGLKRDVMKYGACVEQEFSFSNTLIRATFGFTRFVLDLLGRINTVCQERFASVTELWDFVQSLKNIVDLLVEQD